MANHQQAIAAIGLDIKHLSKEVNAIRHFAQGHKQTGLLLDISRHFYPLAVIKKYVDFLSKIGADYFQLHFSDNRNYALESEILGQTKAEANRDQGHWVNTRTNKPFLSNEELVELVDYCTLKGIEFIPELGTPAHMGGIVALVELKRGKAIRDQLFSENGELKYTETDAVNYVKDLMGEVLDTINLKRLKRFHLGGDEFGYSEENNGAWVTYLKDINAWLNARGLMARLWNDGLIKAQIENIPKNIEVTYWQYYGDGIEEDQKEELKRIRCTVDDLIKAGFQVYNCNYYYTYSVPRSASQIEGDASWAANDAKTNWHLGTWDAERKTALTSSPNLIAGSMMSIWGERMDEDQDLDQALEYLKPHIRAIVSITQQHNAHSEFAQVGVRLSALEEQLKQLAEEFTQFRNTMAT